MNKKNGIGFKSGEYDFRRKDVINEIKRFLKIELINRLDEIIIFKHLNEKNIYDILDKQLDELKKVMRKKEIIFDVSENLKWHIVRKCDYFQYGARTVRREIEKNIEDFIVEKLIYKEINFRKKILLDFDESNKKVIISK